MGGPIGAEGLWISHAKDAQSMVKFNALGKYEINSRNANNVTKTETAAAALFLNTS